MPANADRLVELGLTSYEAKAYLALIRRGSTAAADVARLAGIPRQRIYDVLGLARSQKGSRRSDPARQRSTPAVAPEFAIERLLLDPPGGARRARALEPRDDRARSRRLRRGPEGARPDGLHRGAARPRARSTSASASCRKAIEREILVFTKPPYATPAQENVEGLEVSPKHKAASVYEFSRARRPSLRRGRPPLRRGRRGGSLRRASCR